MKQDDKNEAEYPKPGGRALERLRQFNMERGLSSPDPSAEPEPVEKKKEKKKKQGKKGRRKS